MTTLLTVAHVTFGYKKNQPAVKDLTFEIQQGEVVGLIGPNGSGKSTTIKLIFDRLQLRQGAIRIGDSPHGKPAAQADAIYLPSDDYLPTFLTGMEYILLVGKMYDQTFEPPAVEELLGALGMAGRSGDLIERYSHGMRKKLQLATAFLVSRPLTVIDETFNGVDLDALRVAKDLIRSSAHRGRAFLVCSHDFSLLEDVASRALILQDGRLVDDVPLADRDNARRLSDQVDTILFGTQS